MSIRIVALIQIVTLFICVGAVLAPCLLAIAWEHVPREQRRVVTLGVKSLLFSVAPLSLPIDVQMTMGLIFILSNFC